MQVSVSCMFLGAACSRIRPGSCWCHWTLVFFRVLYASSGIGSMDVLSFRLISFRKILEWPLVWIWWIHGRCCYSLS